MSPRAGWIAVIVVAVAFAASTAVVLFDLGFVEKIDESERQSLREESARGNGSFFLGYAAGRSHRGGGLHDGK